MNNVKPAEIPTFCILHLAFRLRFSAACWSTGAIIAAMLARGWFG